MFADVIKHSCPS